MKIGTDVFKGQAPHTTPRNLDASMAQLALNSRLQTGNLDAWRQFVDVKTLTAFSPPAAVKTIYKLHDVWLSFKEQVDVARGLIPGDTSYLTFLTSPALYATPQYTTYALATSGAEPYPFKTLPLGMPAPTDVPTLVAGVDTTATTFAVDITDSGNTLATNWATSPVALGGNYASDVTQSSAIGNPQPSYRLNFYNNNEDKPCYLYRNFGISGAAAVQMELDFYMTSAGGQYQCRARIGNDASGAGVSGQVGFPSGTGAGAFLLIDTCTDWTDPGSILAQVALAPLTMSTWYHLKLVLTANADGTVTLTNTLSLAGTDIATINHTVTATVGDYCGVTAAAADLGGAQQTYVDNIHVTASGPNGVTVIDTATSYVYTYVGNNGWESAPGPPSLVINRPDGVSVTVTTATTSPYSPDFGIVTKNIYRAVSGNSGTVFMLVDSIPLAQADYVDTLDDAAISTPGTPLPSGDFDMPPANLQGIIPLPNDCLAGFFDNQLCFSAQGFPYAWPVKNRLTTDTNIVAIRNLDNTVVIGTESFVYTATGNDPSSYSMSEPGEAQACISKRSMVYVDGYGVVFASPTGFQVCAGSAGNVKNATASIFTKEQWEALDPASIIAAVYDGTLFFWCDGPAPDAGFALDTTGGGSGLITLGHHAQAVYVDPLAHALYEVVDVNSEPVEALLPIAVSAPTVNPLHIWQFDAHATDRIRFQHRGKLNIVPYDTTMHFAKVEADEFSNLVARIYADGALLFTKLIGDAKGFRIPGDAAKNTYEAELLGTSSTRNQQMAQGVDELD